MTPPFLYAIASLAGGIIGLILDISSTISKLFSITFISAKVLSIGSFSMLYGGEDIRLFFEQKLIEPCGLNKEVQLWQ